MENVAAEFEHDYDAAFVERLSGLGRDQLIAEYLQLEKQYERAARDAETLRAEVARLRRRLQQQTPSWLMRHIFELNIAVFKDELFLIGLNM